MNSIGRWLARRRYESAVKRNDWPGIEEAAQSYAGRYPDAPEGWWLWATFVWDANGPADAEKIVQEALVRCPDDIHLHYLFAKCLMVRGDWFSARAKLDDLVRRFPDEAAPVVGLAALARADGSVDEVVRLAAVAEDKIRSEDRAGLRRELAILLGSIPGHREDAARLANAGVQDARKDWLAYMLAAALFEGLDEARRVDFLGRARRLFPGDDQSFNAELADLRQQLHASAVSPGSQS